jgi:hypothetical protein
MRSHIYGSVLATLLVLASGLAVRAEDAATSPATSSPPAASESQSPPVSVVRPSILPKASEQPPSREVDAAAPPRHRYVHRHHHRRYASYWAPFPIYLPHLYHHRIVWNRVPWISF